MKPQQITELFRNYLLPSSAGHTLKDVIRVHSLVGSTPHELAKLFANNPIYIHTILKQPSLAQKISAWKEEASDDVDLNDFLTERVITFLGKSNIRNLVAAYRLAKVTGKAAMKKKTDVINLQPQQTLNFALQAEEFAESRKWPFPGQVFVAGLHYDWILGLFQMRKVPEEHRVVLRNAFREGAQISEVTHLIAQRMKAIPLAEHMIAGSMVLPVGKALISALHPKGTAPIPWSSIQADAEKCGYARWIAADHFERKQLGVTFPELSAVWIQALEILSPVYLGVRYALEPWALSGLDPAQEQFANLLSISTWLARNPVLTDDRVLPLLPVQIAWLERNKINLKELRKELDNLWNPPAPSEAPKDSPEEDENS